MAAYSALESENGLPPGLLQRVSMVESGGDQSAVSPAGAVGAFQLMPATAKMLGVDPNDPQQNAAGAAKYLSGLIQRFGLAGGLAAYNEGPGRLQRSGVLPQTQSYVSRVLGMTDTSGVPGLGASLMTPSTLQQLGITPNPADLQKLRTAVGHADAVRADVEKQIPEMQQGYDQAAQRYKDSAPSPPQAPTLPDAPKDQYGDPKRVLGSFLPMLAILGGAMTRRHALAGIQAATGAMEGAHEGDEEKIKLHHQQWLDSMQKIKDDWDDTKSVYDMAREKSIQDFGVDMQQLAARKDMLLLRTSVANGDYDGAAKLIEGWKASVDPVLHVVDEAKQQAQWAAAQGERERHDRWLEQHGNETENPVTAARNDWLRNHPDDQDGAARAAGRVYMEMHPDKASSITDRLRKQLATEPVGKAWETTRQFLGSVQNAAGDPDIENNPVKQIALIDAFQRMATNQAIRGFNLKASQEALPLANRAEVLKARIAGPGGAAIGRRAIKEYIDAANDIASDMKSNYDDALQKATGDAAAEGGLPGAVGMFGDGDQPAAGAGGARPAAQPAGGATKVIGGTTYVQMGGKWYAQ